MEENRINVVVPKDYNGKPIEVVLRQGTAPELVPEKAPKLIKKSGAIDAPFRWLEKRIDTVDQKKCNIAVSRRMMSIHLSIDEENFYSHEITGLLELSEEVKRLKINDSEWDRNELARTLAIRKRFFCDENEFARVIQALECTEIQEKRNSNNTNRKNSRGNSSSESVEINTPESFKLMIPVLQGYEKKEITVSICTNLAMSEYSQILDAKFVLLSEDVYRYIEEVRDKLIDEQVGLLRTLAPQVPIIEI